MAALDFPASSSSPWTAPNGVIYTWNADGYWEASPTGADYLKLDASNDPVTGHLTLGMGLTITDGLEIPDPAGQGDQGAGISFDSNYLGIHQDDYFFRLTDSTQSPGSEILLSADGTASFAGLTTHKAGVNITGSFPLPENVSIPAALRTESGRVSFVGSDVFISGDRANSSGLYCTGTVTYAGTPSRYSSVFATIEGNTSAEEIDGFFASSTLASRSGVATDVIGFRSDLNPQTNKNVFNFYASGNARNFWAGYHLLNGFSREWSWLSTDPAGIRLGIRSNVAANSQFEIATNWRGGGGDGNIAILFSGEKSGSDTSKAIRGAIRISNTGISIQETSDYRLKENIQPIANASELIKQLNPSTYQFKSEPGVICHGFLAHELQTVLPRAVSGTKDGTEAIGTHTDAEGVVTTDVTEPETLPFGATWVQTGTRPVYQGVDQTKLIPLLTKALQEALERIEALEAAAGG